MIAAAEPRTDLRAQRLMHLDVSRGALTDGRIANLPELVREGDVWVLNDAATLPASLAGRAAGRDVELRLLGERLDLARRALRGGLLARRHGWPASSAAPVGG